MAPSKSNGYDSRGIYATRSLIQVRCCWYPGPGQGTWNRYIEKDKTSLTPRLILYHILFELVWVLRSGRNDNIGLMHCVSKKDYLMFLLNVLETMISKVVANPTKYRRTPGAVVQATVIVDVEGFSMNQATYKPSTLFSKYSYFLRPSLCRAFVK